MKNNEIKLDQGYLTNDYYNSDPLNNKSNRSKNEKSK